VVLGLIALILLLNGPTFTPLSRYHHYFWQNNGEISLSSDTFTFNEGNYQKPHVYEMKPQDLIKSHMTHDFVSLTFWNRLKMQWRHLLKSNQSSRDNFAASHTFLLRLRYPHALQEDVLQEWDTLWHRGPFLAAGGFIVTTSWSNLLHVGKLVEKRTGIPLEFVPLSSKLDSNADLHKFLRYENWVQWSRERPEDTCPVKEMQYNLAECHVPKARFHVTVSVPVRRFDSGSPQQGTDAAREFMLHIARSIDQYFHSHHHDGHEFAYQVLPESGKIIFALNGSEKTLWLVEELEKNPFVHWISILGADSTRRVQNRFASQIVQSFNQPAETKMWKRGLNGEGQLIGVGDTGLDYYHCFFYDSANPVPQSQRERRNNPPQPSKHRKIAAFWELQDKIDTTDGHGTHVSGTAVGEAATEAKDEVKMYNSLAHRSKIAFADAGCDTADGCTCPADTECECNLKVHNNKKCEKKFGVVYLPSDLNFGYFPWFHSHGVKIQSNSWGTGYYRDFNFGYSFSSSEIDRFVWDHKDFLPIFAAGNAGGSFGYNSLTSEAESKNALTVGASMSNLASFQEGEQFTDYKKVIDHLRVELYQMYCVGEYSKSPVAHVVTKDERDKLCDDSKDFKTTEDCCAQEAGDCGGQTTVECCGVQKYKPFHKIGFRCCPKCVQWEMEHEKSHFNPNNLATFTARGPTVDGRIKPDIVTVGDQILSSRSLGTTDGNKCSGDQTLKDCMLRREGTSMATPVAAAATALVRQFFVDGYFPHRKALDNGKPNGANKIEPSAALLKAMLIHSTRVLTGKIHLLSQNSWKSLTYQQGDKYRLNLPYFEGFGAIDLSTILDEESPTHRIILPNPTRDAEIYTEGLHTHCIHVVTPKTELKATLVWSDYPSSPAAKITLVNDLDLVIVSPSGKVYYGNGFNSHIGSTRTSPDYQNNVEQISISSPEEGYYNVIVRGHYVPKGPQPYALVISGDVRSSRHQDQCRDIVFDLKGELTKYKALTFTFGVGTAIFVPILLIASIFFFLRYRQSTSKRPYHASRNLRTSQAADYMLHDSNEGPGSGFGRSKSEQELPEMTPEGYTAMRAEPDDEDTAPQSNSNM